MGALVDNFGLTPRKLLRLLHDLVVSRRTLPVGLAVLALIVVGGVHRGEFPVPEPVAKFAKRLGMDFLPAEAVAGEVAREDFEARAAEVAAEPNELAPDQPKRIADSWSEAKRWAQALYTDHPVTAYCGCPYTPDRRVDLESCGYRPNTKYRSRANRVEWEHVMPAYNIGHQRQCWQNSPEGVSGRKWCEETDPVFLRAHNDLHNLLPVIGQLNALRSNYRYGEIPGEFRRYGEYCDFEIHGRVAEPPEYLKGSVARIWFYMRDVYGVKISSRDENQLKAWNNSFPPEPWEYERDRRIAAHQGNSNPYVTLWRRL